MLEVDPIQSEPEPVEGDPVPCPEDEEFFVRPDAGDMEEAIDNFFYTSHFYDIFTHPTSGQADSRWSTGNVQLGRIYWYIPAYTLIYLVSKTGHCGCCSAVPLLHCG